MYCLIMNTFSSSTEKKVQLCTELRTNSKAHSHDSGIHRPRDIAVRVQPAWTVNIITLTIESKLLWNILRKICRSSIFNVYFGIVKTSVTLVETKKIQQKKMWAIIKENYQNEQMVIRKQTIFSPTDGETYLQNKIITYENA